MSWKGGCQCGAVAFEANGDPAKLMACNCSICRPKGYLHWFVPEADFRLLTDDAALASYEFHKRHLHHRFCRTCGVSPFIRDGGGERPVPAGLRPGIRADRGFRRRGPVGGRR
jgi:hypothetical protein